MALGHECTGEPGPAPLVVVLPLRRGRAPSTSARTLAPPLSAVDSDAPAAPVAPRAPRRALCSTPWTPAAPSLSPSLPPRPLLSNSLTATVAMAAALVDARGLRASPRPRRCCPGAPPWTASSSGQQAAASPGELCNFVDRRLVPFPRSPPRSSPSICSLWAILRALADPLFSFTVQAPRPAWTSPLSFPLRVRARGRRLLHELSNSGRRGWSSPSPSWPPWPVPVPEHMGERLARCRSPFGWYRSSPLVHPRLETEQRPSPSPPSLWSPSSAPVAPPCSHHYRSARPGRGRSFTRPVNPGRFN